MMDLFELLDDELFAGFTVGPAVGMPVGAIVGMVVGAFVGTPLLVLLVCAKIESP